MVSFIGFIFIYVLGGITFLPLVALAVFIYIKGGIVPVLSTLQVKQPEPVEVVKDPENVIVKKGWIRVINQYQPKMPEFPSSNNGIISGILSNDNEPRFKKGVVYGVLKYGTLFCFENEKQKEVMMILPMQDYKVELFAPSIEKRTDGELYNKTTVIRLIPSGVTKKDEKPFTVTSFDSFCTLPDENITCNPDRMLYLTCARNIDKEDWYFGLLDANHMLHETQKEGPQYEMIDSTHFNPTALQKLISQVQSTPSHRETAWLNAIIGRLFLSMYKTDRLHDLFETKIRTKIEKTKRPTFLDEIKVRNVDVGDSVPFITEPRLLSLSAEGQVVVEAKLEYRGGLTVEIETDFNWSYSSRMKPIRMHLILAVKLKKMAGRMMFKLKPPPTNRYWTGFFEMPDMELKITPVVADKQIKLNIVTNAIEARIREVMAETMVLPNMTDTAFCPSDGKGGIFGEYKKVKVKHVQTQSELFYDGKQVVRKEKKKAESIKENPTVPDSPEKMRAADALKLKNRRAESVAAVSPSTGPTNDLLEPLDNLELNRPLETSDADVDTASIASSSGRRSFEDSSSVTTGTKWSKNNYLRRRSKVLAEDEDQESSDDEKGTSILSKISSLTSSSNHATTSDAASVRSTSSSGSKREFIMNMAENLLSKKTDDKKEKKLVGTSKNISSTPPPLPPVKHEQPPAKNDPPLPPAKNETLPLPLDILKQPLVSSPEPLSTPPEKPRRQRANTSESQHLERPPLPPRKPSLPAIQVDQELNTADIKENEVKDDVAKDDQPMIPPPLPTTPRPKRETHTEEQPPHVPPRHV